MANENTYTNLPPEQKEKAVQNEMKPFLIYTAIPLIITVIIAMIFGPSL